MLKTTAAVSAVLLAAVATAAPVTVTRSDTLSALANANLSARSTAKDKRGSSATDDGLVEATAIDLDAATAAAASGDAQDTPIFTPSTTGPTSLVVNGSAYANASDASGLAQGINRSTYTIQVTVATPFTFTASLDRLVGSSTLVFARLGTSAGDDSLYGATLDGDNAGTDTLASGIVSGVFQPGTTYYLDLGATAQAFGAQTQDADYAVTLVTPEPAAIALLGGASALTLRRRRR